MTRFSTEFNSDLALELSNLIDIAYAHFDFVKDGKGQDWKLWEPLRRGKLLTGILMLQSKLLNSLRVETLNIL